MKFKFQFEAVLNIRRHQEKKEQQKLGVLLEEMKQLEKSCEALRGQLGEVGDAFAGARLRSALEIRQQYEQQHDIKNRLWQVQDEKDRLAQKIDRQRMRLLEANKNTKVLEKLQDRERTKFIKEQQHMEQVQQNEIATQMYNRTH